MKSKGNMIIVVMIIVACMCWSSVSSSTEEGWASTTMEAGSDATGMPIAEVASTEECFDKLAGSQYHAALYDSTKRQCWMKNGSLDDLRAMRTDGSAGFVTILKSPRGEVGDQTPRGECKELSKDVGTSSDDDLAILAYVQENLLKFRKTIMEHEKYKKDPRALCLSSWNGLVLPSNRSTGATMQPKSGCMVMNVPYIRALKKNADSDISDRALTIGLHELAHIYPFWSKTGDGHDAVFYATHRFYAEFATNPVNALNFRLAVNCRLCTFLTDCTGVCPHCMWQEPNTDCSRRVGKKGGGARSPRK